MEHGKATFAESASCESPVLRAERAETSEKVSKALVVCIASYRCLQVLDRADDNLSAAFDKAVSDVVANKITTKRAEAVPLQLSVCSFAQQAISSVNQGERDRGIRLA